MAPEFLLSFNIPIMPSSNVLEQFIIDLLDLIEVVGHNLVLLLVLVGAELVVVVVELHPN